MSAVKMLKSVESRFAIACVVQMTIVQILFLNQLLLEFGFTASVHEKSQHKGKET